MKKLITFVLLLTILTGCSLFSNDGGIFEGVNQKYYVADLIGDPNNRNVFRATTVFADDAVFELLIPDYWEVKVDEEDLYNTDVYLSSSEFENDNCIVLPGTMGYGIPEEYEKELWQTTVSWGAADDYYFYERISEEERKPVIRIIEFHDATGNYYIIELQFPEENYEACNADFSDMLTTFQTINTPIEETYIEEEIFEPKWPSIAFKNLDDQEDKIVVDYPPEWSVVDDEEENDVLVKHPTDDTIRVGIETRDLNEAASYTEDILVFDNNDMGEKYSLYNEEGHLYMIVVTVTHNDTVYNFELDGSGYVDELNIEDFETIVASFRTLEEENAAKQGYDIFEEEEES